ncbi:MAG: helix-turn-helix domain-containing protein [Gemmataceae bacterium]|nr:helix-turn-helix domain-containing protein [Gemmataceae bacterium]
MKTKQQSLGSRLVRLRSRRGWTQQQLANVAGLSRVQVARLETGVRGQAIRLHTLQRLAEALEVTLEELT